MARQSVSMREYVDVRISELRANIDAAQTEFNADLSGVSNELRSIDSKISGLPGMGKLIFVVGAAVVTGLGTILGVLAVMGDRFDAGMAFNLSSSQQSQQATVASEEAKKAVEKFSNDLTMRSQVWDAQAARLEKILPALEAIAEKASVTESPPAEKLAPSNDLLKQ